MKVMITWKLHAATRHETLAQFSAMTPEQEQGLMGPNLKLIGRWHDLVAGTGAAVYECDSAEAVSAYALSWNKAMDLKLSVVLDDQETRALGQSMAG